MKICANIFTDVMMICLKPSSSECWLNEQTLALAESCAGGFIANRITNIPGASEFFINGLVTYSNESKQRLLCVREETLAQRGAVSEATAREMVEGARQNSKAGLCAGSI